MERGIDAPKYRGVERNATSMIFAFDDLCRIKSLGFEERKLSSIAPYRVNDYKTKDALAGTKVLVDGGAIRESMMWEARREP
jgi:DNA mismatch repair ATPase MutL